MAKVLVLYYSMYGHIQRMAEAVAEGVSEAGAEVAVKRVPELVPEEVLARSGAQRDLSHPVAEPDELADYDAIIVGTPTRFGNMAAQMRNFWDRTGGLWAKGALVGKVGSAFTSAATQHGGLETTLTSTHTTLLHHGLVIVGLPYSCDAQTGVDEIKGGSPYGASTIAAADGSRMPSQQELGMARFQGKHVAQIAAKLAG